MPPTVPIQESAVNQDTTNSYTSLLKARICDMEYCSLVIGNSGDTNDLDFQVLASNDAQGASGTWANVELDSTGATELTLGENTAKPISLSAPFMWIDIQVKSTSSGNATHASAWLLAR